MNKLNTYLPGQLMLPGMEDEKGTPSMGERPYQVVDEGGKEVCCGGEPVRFASEEEGQEWIESLMIDHHHDHWLEAIVIDANDQQVSECDAMFTYDDAELWIDELRVKHINDPFLKRDDDANEEAVHSSQKSQGNSQREVEKRAAKEIEALSHDLSDQLDEMLCECADEIAAVLIEAGIVEPSAVQQILDENMSDDLLLDARPDLVSTVKSHVTDLRIAETIISDVEQSNQQV
jgi:hypothetical protein